MCVRACARDSLSVVKCVSGRVWASVRLEHEGRGVRVSVRVRACACVWVCACAWPRTCCADRTAEYYRSPLPDGQESWSFISTGSTDGQRTVRAVSVDTAHCWTPCEPPFGLALDPTVSFVYSRCIYCLLGEIWIMTMTHDDNDNGDDIRLNLLRCRLNCRGEGGDWNQHEHTNAKMHPYDKITQTNKQTNNKQSSVRMNPIPTAIFTSSNKTLTQKQDPAFSELPQSAKTENLFYNSDKCSGHIYIAAHRVRSFDASGRRTVCACTRKRGESLTLCTQTGESSFARFLWFLSREDMTDR
jgi:hypothetical protein